MPKKPSGRGSGDKRKKALPVPGSTAGRSTTVVLYVGRDSANVSFCAKWHLRAWSSRHEALFTMPLLCHNRCSLSWPMTQTTPRHTQEDLPISHLLLSLFILIRGLNSHDRQLNASVTLVTTLIPAFWSTSIRGQYNKATASIRLRRNLKMLSNRNAFLLVIGTFSPTRPRLHAFKIKVIIKEVSWEWWWAQRDHILWIHSSCLYPWLCCRLRCLQPPTLVPLDTYPSS